MSLKNLTGDEDICNYNKQHRLSPVQVGPRVNISGGPLNNSSGVQNAFDGKNSNDNNIYKTRSAPCNFANVNKCISPSCDSVSSFENLKKIKCLSYQPITCALLSTLNFNKSWLDKKKQLYLTDVCTDYQKKAYFSGRFCLREIVDIAKNEPSHSFSSDEEKEKWGEYWGLLSGSVLTLWEFGSLGDNLCHIPQKKSSLLTNEYTNVRCPDPKHLAELKLFAKNSFFFDISRTVIGVLNSDQMKKFYVPHGYEYLIVITNSPESTLLLACPSSFALKCWALAIKLSQFEFYRILGYISKNLVDNQIKSITEDKKKPIIVSKVRHNKDKLIKDAVITHTFTDKWLVCESIFIDVKRQNEKSPCKIWFKQTKNSNQKCEVGNNICKEWNLNLKFKKGSNSVDSKRSISNLYKAYMVIMDTDAPIKCLASSGNVETVRGKHTLLLFKFKRKTPGIIDFSNILFKRFDDDQKNENSPQVCNTSNIEFVPSNISSITSTPLSLLILPSTLDEETLGLLQVLHEGLKVESYDVMSELSLYNYKYRTFNDAVSDAPSKFKTSVNSHDPNESNDIWGSLYLSLLDVLGLPLKTLFTMDFDFSPFFDIFSQKNNSFRIKMVSSWYNTNYNLEQLYHYHEAEEFKSRSALRLFSEVVDPAVMLEKDTTILSSTNTGIISPMLSIQQTPYPMMGFPVSSNQPFPGTMQHGISNTFCDQYYPPSNHNNFPNNYHFHGRDLQHTVHGGVGGVYKNKKSSVKSCIIYPTPQSYIGNTNFPGNINDTLMYHTYRPQSEYHPNRLLIGTSPEHSPMFVKSPKSHQNKKSRKKEKVSGRNKKSISPIVPCTKKSTKSRKKFTKSGKNLNQDEMVEVDSGKSDGGSVKLKPVSRKKKKKYENKNEHVFGKNGCCSKSVEEVVNGKVNHFKEKHIVEKEEEKTHLLSSPLDVSFILKKLGKDEQDEESTDECDDLESSFSSETESVSFEKYEGENGSETAESPTSTNDGLGKTCTFYNIENDNIQTPSEFAISSTKQKNAASPVVEVFKYTQKSNEDDSKPVNNDNSKSDDSQSKGENGFRKNNDGDRESVDGDRESDDGDRKSNDSDRKSNESDRESDDGDRESDDGERESDKTGSSNYDEDDSSSDSSSCSSDTGETSDTDSSHTGSSSDSSNSSSDDSSSSDSVSEDSDNETSYEYVYSNKIITSNNNRNYADSYRKTMSRAYTDNTSLNIDPRMSYSSINTQKQKRMYSHVPSYHGTESITDYQQRYVSHPSFQYTYDSSEQMMHPHLSHQQRSSSSSQLSQAYMQGSIMNVNRYQDASNSQNKFADRPDFNPLFNPGSLIYEAWTKKITAKNTSQRKLGGFVQIDPIKDQKNFYYVNRKIRNDIENSKKTSTQNNTSAHSPVFMENLNTLTPTNSSPVTTNNSYTNNTITNSKRSSMNRSSSYDTFFRSSQYQAHPFQNPNLYYR